MAVLLIDQDGFWTAGSYEELINSLVEAGKIKKKRERIGRWMPIGNPGEMGEAWHICSNCGYGHRHRIASNVLYCEECGAKMGVKTLEEIKQIAEILEEADKLGMTYGKYVAKLERDRELEERKKKTVKVKPKKAKKMDDAIEPPHPPAAKKVTDSGKFRKEWREVRRLFGKD